MINTSQNALDAILNLLQNNDEIAPSRGQAFRGTGGDDVFIAGETNNSTDDEETDEEIDESVDQDQGIDQGSTQESSLLEAKRDDTLVAREGSSRMDGETGNDLLIGSGESDTLDGGTNRDTLLGGLGDDILNGEGGLDFLDGEAGADFLTGGNGIDRLVGGAGVDTLTGGNGLDQFIYGDVFANGAPTLVAAPNIEVLNTPDIITDYTIGQDRFVFDQATLGLDSLTFQKGNSAEIASDGNAIVLTNGFAAAGAAARAIANNDTITAKEGVFAYFNTTLGLTRVVYSKDLGNGGDISVLANLDNQRGDVGLANIATMTAADFTLG